MLTYDPERAERYTGTSASDCEMSIMTSARNSPVDALADVANALHHLNTLGLDKKSHRQALAKGGRAALKKLGGV